MDNTYFPYSFLTYWEVNIPAIAKDLDTFRALFFFAQAHAILTVIFQGVEEYIGDFDMP